MKKLTQEQNQMLLARIRAQTNLGFDNFVCAVSKIINECTGKEFPILDIAINSHDQQESISLRQMACVDEGCKVVCSTRRHVLHFSLKEFKAFTDGCIAICKWFEGQEE